MFIFMFWMFRFLVHISRRLKCTVVTTRCPSSIVRPSRELFTFSTFSLKPRIDGMEFNETWQEARFQRPLSNLCFSGRSEKQDGRPGLWLAETFLTSISATAWWNSTKLNRKKVINILCLVSCWANSSTKMAVLVPSRSVCNRYSWIYINQTWQEASIRCPLMTRSDTRVNKDDCRGLLLACQFDSSSAANTNALISTILYKKREPRQDLNVLYQVCVFRTDRKTRWLSWPRADKKKQQKTRWSPRSLIGWDIFDFSCERNSAKFDSHSDSVRKQDLTDLYQVCVFRPIRKTKCPPGSGLANTFSTFQRN